MKREPGQWIVDVHQAPQKGHKNVKWGLVSLVKDIIIIIKKKDYR